MYIDAGNIKTLVTRRDIDASKIEAALGSLDEANLARLGTVFPQERYLKILGEGPHIDHALHAIELGSGTPIEIANALKSFAKHGERVVNTVGADVATDLLPFRWGTLSKEFALIMQTAKAGALPAQVATDLAALQAKVAAQAAILERGMTTAARALREQAALGAALTAQQSAGITAWAAAEATTRLKLEALKKALQALHLGMVTGRVAGDALDLVDEPSGEVPLPELTPQ